MTFAASQRRQMTPLGTSSRLRDRGFLHLYVMAGATLLTWLFITSMEETGFWGEHGDPVIFYPVAGNRLAVRGADCLWLTDADADTDTHARRRQVGDNMFSYCVLMGWFMQLYNREAHVRVAMLCVALGVLMEYAQSASGYRDFEYLDMAADAVGVSIAWALGGTALARLLARLEQRMGALQPGRASMTGCWKSLTESMGNH